MNEYRVGDIVRFINKDEGSIRLYNKIGKIIYCYDYSYLKYYKIMFGSKVEVVFNFELEPAKKEFLIYRRKK
jgi:hypothetical protein